MNIRGIHIRYENIERGLAVGLRCTSLVNPQIGVRVTVRIRVRAEDVLYGSRSLYCPHHTLLTLQPDSTTPPMRLPMGASCMAFRASPVAQSCFSCDEAWVESFCRDPARLHKIVNVADFKAWT